MNCHICGAETEFTCDDCGEPVCEDCCTPYTIHNQIDYPLCKWCHEGNEAERARYYREEEKVKEAKETKRKAANAKARANYWKPENVAKRNAAKIERKKKQAEQARKMLAEAFKVVGDMFK